ncbi:7889_t:CDS:2, partial [Acaulospora colombiana]
NSKNGVFTRDPGISEPFVYPLGVSIGFLGGGTNIAYKAYMSTEKAGEQYDQQGQYKKKAYPEYGLDGD